MIVLLFLLTRWTGTTYVMEGVSCHREEQRHSGEALLFGSTDYLTLKVLGV